MEEAKAAITEAKEIVALCRVTGATAEAAGGFVKARKPLADVRKEINAAQVAANTG